MKLCSLYKSQNAIPNFCLPPNQVSFHENIFYCIKHHNLEANVFVNIQSCAFQTRIICKILQAPLCMTIIVINYFELLICLHRHHVNKHCCFLVNIHYHYKVHWYNTNNYINFTNLATKQKSFQQFTNTTKPNSPILLFNVHSYHTHSHHFCQIHFPPWITMST